MPVGRPAHGAAAESLLSSEPGQGLSLHITWLLTSAGHGAGARGAELKSLKMWFPTCNWRPWVVLASFKKSDKLLPAIFQAEHNFHFCPHPTTIPSLMLRMGISPVSKAAHVGLCVVFPSFMSCASLLPTHPMPQTQGKVSL